MAELKKLKPKELVEMEPQPEQRAEIHRRLERLEILEPLYAASESLRQQMNEQAAKDLTVFNQVRERLEKCEADTARLDWLDAQRDNGLPEIYLGGPWKWISDEHPAVGQWKVRPATEKATAYESLRAAIDAARAALEGHLADEKKPLRAPDAWT